MKLVFFTGAGISVAAGLPTYRGKDGRYTPGSKNFVPPVVMDEKLSRADFLLACETMIASREKIAAIEPTEAHKMISALEYDYDVTVITQNIDELHQKAGSTAVIELHGSLFRTKHSKRFDCDRPDVVFFGEQLDNKLYQRSLDYVDIADVFISIGTSGQVFPAADIMKWGFDRSYRYHTVRAYHIDPLPPEIKYMGAKHLKTTADEGMKELLELL